MVEKDRTGAAKSTRTLMGLQGAMTAALTVGLTMLGFYRTIHDTNPAGNATSNLARNGLTAGRKHCKKRVIVQKNATPAN